MRKSKQEKQFMKANMRGVPQGNNLSFLKFVLTRTKGNQKHQILSVLIEGVIQVKPHHITEIDNEEMLYDVDNLGIVRMMVCDKDCGSLQDIQFQVCNEGIELVGKYDESKCQHVYLIAFINDVKENQKQFIETYQVKDQDGHDLPVNIYFVYVPYIDEVVKQKKMQS